MVQWARPFHRETDDYQRWLGTGMAIIGGLVVGVQAVMALDKPLAAAIYAAFAVAWVVGCVRIVLVEVYLGSRGVKIRHVHRTRVVPWSAVTRVWAGPAAAYDAWQIWVSAGGRDFETPIWREESRARHRNRIVLPPAEFAATLNALDPRRP